MSCLEHANKIEDTILEKLQSQIEIYEGYNVYLQNFVKKIYGYLSFEPFQAKTPLIATDCFLRHKGKRDVIIFYA